MTTIAKTIQLEKKKKLNVDELMQIIRKGIDESIGDMIVTVFVTGATVIYIFLNTHPVYAKTVPGLYIFGMMIQLMIRIVQRFDENYTVQELANQMLGFEDRVMTRLNDIDNHLVPY
jgi:archaellum biogenesis protein FlaJ (TadC family)